MKILLEVIFLLNTLFFLVATFADGGVNGGALIVALVSAAIVWYIRSSK